MRCFAGIVTSRVPLDREKVPEYRLTMMAQDGGERFCTADVYIVLSDVNDNAPRFTQPEYRVHIAEDAQINTLLTRVAAADSDLGEHKNQSQMETCATRHIDQFSCYSESIVFTLFSLLVYPLHYFKHRDKNHWISFRSYYQMDIIQILLSDGYHSDLIIGWILFRSYNQMDIIQIL